MPDGALSRLLAEDQAALTRRLEREPLTEAVLTRLARRERRRWTVLGLAALAGVVVAASQLPMLLPLTTTGFGIAVPAVLTAGMLLIAATTAALGWNLGER